MVSPGSQDGLRGIFDMKCPLTRPFWPSQVSYSYRLWFGTQGTECGSQWKVTELNSCNFLCCVRFLWVLMQLGDNALGKNRVAQKKKIPNKNYRISSKQIRTKRSTGQTSRPISLKIRIFKQSCERYSIKFIKSLKLKPYYLFNKYHLLNKQFIK